MGTGYHNWVRPDEYPPVRGATLGLLRGARNDGLRRSGTYNEIFTLIH